MFCIYLRTNSDLCHLQHKLIGFYNRDEKCLQRGTDWVIKYSGPRFGCIGLRIYSESKNRHAQRKVCKPIQQNEYRQETKTLFSAATKGYKHVPFSRCFQQGAGRRSKKRCCLVHNPAPSPAVSIQFTQRSAVRRVGGRVGLSMKSVPKQSICLKQM